MKSWLDPWQGQETCLYKEPRQALGPTEPPLEWVWELYLRVEWSWREAHHSSPSLEVMSGAMYTSMPHIP